MDGGRSYNNSQYQWGSSSSYCYFPDLPVLLARWRFWLAFNLQRAVSSCSADPTMIDLLFFFCIACTFELLFHKIQEENKRTREPSSFFCNFKLSIRRRRQDFIMSNYLLVSLQSFLKTQISIKYVEHVENIELHQVRGAHTWGGT